MNQESKNLIYDVLNTLKDFSRRTTDKPNAFSELANKLELALRDGEKYNGWTNYETWNMHLILTNNQAIFNEIYGFIKQELSEYDVEDKPFSSLTNQAKQDILLEIAESLKDYIYENYQFNDTDMLIKVDCEFWTYRDFQEINWYPIVKAFLEDYLREAGYKEE
jgi:hypothetical protein